MMDTILNREIWSEVPFGFWALVFFVFGCIVGSFLNVCIHRMPLGESLVTPPSHCPQCRYSIPWYLNVPLVTWLWLGAKCANCRKPIPARYFFVELLTGVAFMGCWLRFGERSPATALCMCLLMSGFLVATVIDFEHFIIPDEITLGGIAAGVTLSALVPALHLETSHKASLLLSGIGAAVGWGITHAVLKLGKLLFGRKRVKLEPGTRVDFTETGVKIDGEETRYEDIFGDDDGDTIRLHAATVHVPSLGRTWREVKVRLSPRRLQIGTDLYDPESIPSFTVTSDLLDLPRDAMGFGDVKFMGAIGAFLGWQGAVFALLASSVLGSVVGIGLIAIRKLEWSARIPYGPYIAVAATVWVFIGDRLVAWWQRML